MQKEIKIKVKTEAEGFIAILKTSSLLSRLYKA